MKSGFQDFKNFGKNFEGFLMGKKQNQSKNKSKTVLGVRDFNAEIETDPIFLKIQCLKKILFKFSNKTFTYKNEKEDEKSYEVLIKIKICEVFTYLMDLRHDFFIDNLMAYFNTSFIDRFRDINKDFLDFDINFEDFQTILPETMIEVGKKLTIGKFKNYTNEGEFKFFDEILKRPFIEILLLSFYFADNSILQNKLMDLIYRCCNQKLEFSNLIYKLEILFSKEQIEVYEKYNKYVQKLNLLVSNSQV